MPARPANSKQSTQQAYRQKVNQVLDAVAQNLPQSLSLAELADLAALSPFHFHRIFARLTGESPGRLITRTRLEKVAFLLRYTPTDLRAIAKAVGYESVDSLSKAFRKQFGCSPRDYHQPIGSEQPEAKTGRQPIDDRLRVMVGQGRLVHRPPGQFLYARGQGFADGHYNQVAHQIWPRLLAFARQQQLLNSQTEYLARFPHCTAVTQAHQCHYEAGIRLTTDQPVVVSGEFGIGHEPGGPFMVFTHHGPYAQLWESWQAIVQHWLPGSAYWLRPAASLELYPGAAGFVNQRQVPVHLYLPVA